MTPEERIRQYAREASSDSWLGEWRVVACEFDGSAVLAVHLGCTGAAFCVRWDSLGASVKSGYTTLDGAMAIYMRELSASLGS